jgi:hypothetical protein
MAIGIVVIGAGAATAGIAATGKLRASQAVEARL